MVKFNASETWWQRERERQQVSEMLEFKNRIVCSPEFINNCRDLIVFMSSIIIIIIIIISSFMQGIYTFIPKINYVPREHSVAAILLLLFMVLISLLLVLNLLYFYISTFRSMCAVPNMAVFCSSLTLWFPGMLLTYFLSVFKIVPVIIIFIIIVSAHYYCRQFALKQHSRALRHSCPDMVCISLYWAKLQAF